MPVLTILLVLGVLGAITDWKYHKGGGKPSSRNDRILFWVLTLLVAGAITFAELTDWDPYGILGFVILPITVFLFAGWELGRWRMRRKYPLANSTPQVAPPK
jgi:hypothetical protein